MLKAHGLLWTLIIISFIAYEQHVAKKPLKEFILTVTMIVASLCCHVGLKGTGKWLQKKEVKRDEIRTYYAISFCDENKKITPGISHHCVSG